jgi:osmotically-inducible protein OsmY
VTSFLLPRCSARPTRAQATREETQGNELEDAAITKKIMTASLFHPHPDSFHIDLHRRDDIIMLRDGVNSGIHKGLAGEMARNADGVKAAALLTTRGWKAPEVHIPARRGAETLTGEVDSPAEERLARKIAGDTIGGRA